MFDTGLDNELLTSDTGLENSVAEANQTEADTYWVITYNTLGGAASPFTGDTAQLVQMTEQDLKQEYEDSSQIRDHFGSFENYMTYIGESQEWIQSADWMNASMEYDPTDRKWLYQNNEDARWEYGERDRLKTQIDFDQAYAKQGEYIGWLNAGSELLEKWGLNDKRVIYNSDGDQFKWTGSGYQKTIKVDDHASFGDYAKAILKTVVTSALTYGIGQAITSGQLGAGLADGVGKATQFVKDALVQGLGNVPYLSSHAGTIADFFFPTINEGGFLGTGATSDPFAILSGVTGAGAGSSTWENAADAVNQAMNSGIIVNLTNAIDNQGGYEGEESDGYTQGEDETYTITNPDNLPPGYIINPINGNIIHEATGTVVYGGDAREELYPVPGYGANFITFEPYKEGDEGGGVTDGSPSTSPTQPTTADSSEPTDSTDSSESSSPPITTSPGGSPDESGGPDWPILTGPSGDVPVNDNPDIWNDEDGYAGWVIVSGTGVWGQSGVWVIKNPNTGQTQEVDWDNGTYSSPWENNPNSNDADTDGNNQGEGQGDDTASTASGPETEASPAEETVDYPDDGSACWLSDGTIGAKKSGECVPTTDPFNDIIGWPYVLPSEPYKPDTPPVDPADPNASASTDPSTDTSSTSDNTSGGSTDSNGGTDSNGTAGEGGSNTGGENGTGENGNNGPGNEGDGTGDGGNGGDGNGPSNPNQFIDGSGGISKTTWTPLFRGTKFVPHTKRGGGMMTAMQSPNFTAPDYTQQRQGLLSQAWKDLA